MSEHKHLVHTDKMDWAEFGDGKNHMVAMKRLGHAAGGSKLGCSLYRQAPGKKAFPFHRHHGIEEGVYVMEGRGCARIGEERVTIAAGDYLAFPPGIAHQIINDSEADLVYLCFSTMDDPDVVEYPDSGKIGMATGHSRSGGGRPRTAAFFPHDAKVSYWNGEN